MYLLLFCVCLVVHLCIFISNCYLYAKLNVSLQKCSSGFLRQDAGRWLGKCYNDTPPCSPGTYGDPKRGIPCQTCPCPYTSPANQ